MRQYATALDGLKAQSGNIGIGRTKPGTINALAVAYYQSPDFRSLADSTKDHRRRIIDKFRTRHGDKPLKGLGREHIVQIIADKAETPEAAKEPSTAGPEAAARLPQAAASPETTLIAKSAFTARL